LGIPLFCPFYYGWLTWAAFGAGCPYIQFSTPFKPVAHVHIIGGIVPTITIDCRYEYRDKIKPKL
jgi:hypothetical protein